MLSSSTGWFESQRVQRDNENCNLCSEICKLSHPYAS